jgi:peroxiredoxin
MDAYRDQYAQLFNGGKDVTLLAISTDAVGDLASWAKDAGYPFTFLSDTGGRVGKQYGAFNPAFRLDNRTLYVVGPDGTIVHRAVPFREVDPTAYSDLGAAVRKARGGQ